MTDRNLPPAEPPVKTRILELLAEGLSIDAIAAKLKTTVGYVYKVTRAAGVPTPKKKRGPLRDDELSDLGAWPAAIGRWISTHLREDYFDARELSARTGISAYRLTRAEIGALALDVTELARLAAEFGEPPPAFVADRPRAAYAAARREKGISDGTIRKELGTLRAGLRWARPRGAEQVFDAIELPPAPAPKTRHLTHAEFRRLLGAASGNQSAEAVEDVGNHIRLFVVLALTTGGRKEAILQLTWDRVDFERGMIRLGDGTQRVKGRATVPMTEQARIELVKARKASMSDHVIEWGGRPIKEVKTGFGRAVVKAGLGKDVTPHVLRHTAAVWMAEDGHSMAEIAQYLGHSNSVVTERVYARFSPTHLRKASAALKW